MYGSISLKVWNVINGGDKRENIGERKTIWRWKKEERERETEKEEKRTRQIRMFIWSRNFQSGITMNILMTSCGCSRLWASCKVGIREESGTSLYGGWRRARGWKGVGEKNRLQQKGSPRSLLSLEIIIAPLTVPRLVPPSLSLFHLSFSVSSTFRPSRSNVPFLYGTLISFYGNCVYGTTRELQAFVISWNCQALVAFFKGRPWIVFLFDESFTIVFVFCQEAFRWISVIVNVVSRTIRVCK